MIDYVGKLFWRQLRISQSVDNIMIYIPFQLCSKENNNIIFPIADLMEEKHKHFKNQKITYAVKDLSSGTFYDETDKQLLLLFRRIHAAVVDRLMQEYESWFHQTKNKIVTYKEEIRIQYISTFVRYDPLGKNTIALELRSDDFNMLTPLYADSKKYPYANINIK